MSKYIEMKIPHPYFQAGGVVVTSLVIMVIGRFTASNELFPWLTSGAFLLLFTVFNNSAAIFADRFGRYAQRSLTAFVGTLIVLGFLAFLISGISIFDAKSYRTIYTIMIITHFALLAIGFLVRSVVDFLMSKDEAKAKKESDLES